MWLNDLLLLNVELIQLLESLDLSQQVFFWHLCSCLRCHLFAVFTHVHGRCWCAGLFASLGPSPQAHAGGQRVATAVLAAWSLCLFQQFLTHFMASCLPREMVVLSWGAAVCALGSACSDQPGFWCRQVSYCL